MNISSKYMFVGVLIIVVIFLVAFSSVIPQFTFSIRKGFSRTANGLEPTVTDSTKTAVFKERVEPGLRCPPCSCSPETADIVSHDGDFYITDICVSNSVKKCMSTEGASIHFDTAFDGIIQVDMANTGSDVGNVPLSITDNYEEKTAATVETGTDSILSSTLLTYTSANALTKNYKFTHGRHDIDINVDNTGKFSEADETNNREVIQIIVNRLPTGSFTNDQCYETIPCNFDASVTDADGDSLIYDWDFADGNTAIGDTATNAFSSAGTYDVTLTVDDEIENIIITKTIDVMSLDDNQVLCEDSGYHWGVDLFDDPTNYDNPNCCGNNMNENYVVNPAYSFYGNSWPAVPACCNVNQCAGRPGDCIDLGDYSDYLTAWTGDRTYLLCTKNGILNCWELLPYQDDPNYWNGVYYNLDGNKVTKNTPGAYHCAPKRIGAGIIGATWCPNQC